METVSTNLKKDAVMSGLIWGVIDIVLLLLVYYVAFSFMGSTWYSVTKMILAIALAVFFTRDLRNKAGGFWTFSQALKHIFIMFMVSAILVAVFTFMFGKFIDPSYPVKMKELISTSTMELYENMGMTGDALDQANTALDEQLEKQYNPTVSQAIVAFGIIGIFYFIGALIFAAIFKRNPPMFIEEEEEEYIAPTTV